MARISAAQRHTNEQRIRTAMDRILRGELPPVGKWDVKTLAAEAGVDRTSFYGTRPYAPLRVEFEQRLQAFSTPAPVGCVNAFMQLVGTHVGDRRAGRDGGPDPAEPRRGS